MEVPEMEGGLLLRMYIILILLAYDYNHEVA